MILRYALRAACALVASTALTGVLAPVASGATWNAAADFKPHPNQANPTGDSYGHTGIWEYRQGASLVRTPSAYTRLAGHDPSYCDATGAERWIPGTGNANDGDNYPFIGKNTTAATLSSPCGGTDSWTTGRLIVHPSATRLAVVEWHSPFDGSVDIGGSVVDVDPGCIGFESDGVGWAIDKGPSDRSSKTTLASGDIANTESETFSGSALHGVAVDPGDIVYLAIDPQPFGSPNCDTTAVDLTVEAVGETPSVEVTQPTGVTNAQPVVAGTSANAPGGSRVNIFLRQTGGAGFKSMQTVVDANGAWSAVATTPLPDGEWTVEAELVVANNRYYDTGSFRVDATPPTPTIHSPAPHSQFVAGDEIAFAYSCTDVGTVDSHVACQGVTPHGTLLSGGTFHLTEPGHYSVSVTARDPVGNERTVHHDFEVIPPARAAEVGDRRVLSGDTRDTDGDALLDFWESGPIDTNGDRKPDIDLSKMGADPLHKDVFVEVDSQGPVTASGRRAGDHRLSNDVFSSVAMAFRRAPVTNPDGEPGIDLHFDNGPDSKMEIGSGVKWGALSRADTLPHEALFGSGRGEPGRPYDWSAFERVKTAHFSRERARIFHYMLSVDSISNVGIRGTSRGVNGWGVASDFMVGFGGLLCTGLPDGPNCLSESEQSATVMHELGHNLGLRHGGGDDITPKPNYFSVMNYAFAGAGLMDRRGGLRGFDAMGYEQWSLDYSRLESDVLPELSEAGLDEERGLAAAQAVKDDPWTDELVTFFFCPNGDARTPHAWSYLDWNCDGKVIRGGAPVAADVNRTGRQDRLKSFDDWKLITFRGGWVGATGPLPALPLKTPVGAGASASRDARAAAGEPTGEPSHRELRANQRALTGDSKAPRVRLTRRGRGKTLVVRGSDNKGLTAVVIDIDRRQQVVRPRRKGQVRTLRITRRIPQRARRVYAFAFDGAGNIGRSRAIKIRR